MTDSAEHWHFDDASRRQFQQALGRETQRLQEWFERDAFSSAPATIGYEMEVCLVDQNFAPADANHAFLERLAMEQAVPELARFNVEFNGSPQHIAGDGLRQMQAEMDDWLGRAREVAQGMGLQVALIGMLPTLESRHMSLDHISPSPRYRALNAAVAELRSQERVHIDIRGREHYRGEYDSIMPESAATSFQLHISLPPAAAARWYNAAQIAAGPLLAVAANAPFLFGHDLWAETRVPVFAQAVDTGKIHFVTFGHSYLQSSLFELFAENAERFPVLLPQRHGDEGIEHLLAHNGTIWRWNRPVVGEYPGADQAQLRLEHRSLPTGPSVLDMVANSAFFFGLTQALATSDPAPESRLPFVAARTNFYRAARDGLDAQLAWLDGATTGPGELFSQVLLPMARQGLLALEVDPDVASRYLDVIAARVHRGLSGAGWQRAWVRQHGENMHAMLAAYVERQNSGAPIAEWSL